MLLEETVRLILSQIGEDPDREGLLETPARVVKSWKELYGGYEQDIPSLFKIFEDGACQEMVLLRDVEFYSMCEHHMLPFVGRAHIAYIPDGKVIGVSKLARIFDAYAHRLQIQERLGMQVTEALMEHLQPKGAACIIKAYHLCMRARGVKKQSGEMVTSSLRGCFLDEPETRAELYSLISL